MSARSSYSRYPTPRTPPYVYPAQAPGSGTSRYRSHLRQVTVRNNCSGYSSGRSIRLLPASYHARHCFPWYSLRSYPITQRQNRESCSPGRHLQMSYHSGKGHGFPDRSYRFPPCRKFLRQWNCRNYPVPHDHFPYRRHRDSFSPAN